MPNLRSILSDPKESQNLPKIIRDRSRIFPNSWVLSRNQGKKQFSLKSKCTFLSISDLFWTCRILKEKSYGMGASSKGIIIVWWQLWTLPLSLMEPSNLKRPCSCSRQLLRLFKHKSIKWMAALQRLNMTQMREVFNYKQSGDSTSHLLVRIAQLKPA